MLKLCLVISDFKILAIDEKYTEIRVYKVRDVILGQSIMHMITTALICIL